MKDVPFFQTHLKLPKSALLFFIVLFQAAFLCAQSGQEVLITQYRTELEQRGTLKKEEIDRLVTVYTTLLNQKSNSPQLPISQEMRQNPPSCRNGDFENTNTFAGWNFFTGCNLGGLPIGSGITVNPIPCGNCTCNTLGSAQGSSNTSCGQLQAGRNSGGFDPTLTAATPLFNLRTVPIGGGAKSVVLGNSSACFAVEGIYRTVTLPSVSPTITFKYALVMQRSHSNANNTPNGSEVFFLVRVKNMLGNELKRYEEIGNPSNPFVQKTNNGAIFYKDWDCVTLDLTGYEGQTVVVEFINSDCSAGGHWGYTYLDDFCVGCKGTSGGGTVQIVKADPCILAGAQVNGAFALPTIGANTGTLTGIQLLIYQNGTLVNTVNGPVISGTNYSFLVNPSDFPSNATVKCYDLIVKATFTITNPYSGQTSTLTSYSSPLGTGAGTQPGLNNDICFCPDAPCCPGDNLVQNPNFNNGNTNFTSDYTVENTPAPNSIMPGEYGVINGAQAATVSPQWNIQNPAPCDNTSKFLVVNGRTGQTTGKKKIWEQTINNLTPNTSYRFCVKMKNLPQCAFDVKPSVEITFSNGANAIIQTINTNASLPCDWTLLSTTVTPTTNSVTIRILLDEAPIGDGNDLAIDAFGLHPAPPLPQIYRDFTLQTLNMNSSAQTYNLTATPTTPLPAGCSYYWEVCEINCPGSCKNCNANNCVSGTQITNPQQWWTPTTTFPGYNSSAALSGTGPGVFKYGKRYLVRRGVWCDCNAWSESRYCIEYEPSSRKVRITPLQDNKP